MFPKDIYLIKRNLKRACYYRCLPIQWDAKQEKVVVIGTQSQKIVILTLFVNFLISLCRLFATFVYSSSLIDQAEAATGAMLYSAGFLIRCDLPVDQITVQLANFLNRHPNNEFGMVVHIYIFLLE